MSGREKIEKDYKESEKRIEKAIEVEIEQIKRRTYEIKLEAEKIAEAVQISINQNE